MSLKWLLLPTRQLLVGYETRNKYKARGEQFNNRGRGHFPRNFWSSYEYLIHYQSEDDSCAC